jgi:hypothetical protein
VCDPVFYPKLSVGEEKGARLISTKPTCRIPALVRNSSQNGTFLKAIWILITIFEIEEPENMRKKHQETYYPQWNYESEEKAHPRIRRCKRSNPRGKAERMGLVTKKEKL